MRTRLMLILNYTAVFEILLLTSFDHPKKNLLAMTLLPTMLVVSVILSKLTLYIYDKIMIAKNNIGDVNA